MEQGATTLGTGSRGGSGASASAASRGDTTLVSLSLPKFHVLTEVLLKGVLMSPGMESAFEGGADFSGMCDRPPCIDNVCHDADITVDEAGMETAAATAVVMVDGGISPVVEEPVAFVVDRPFVFLLRDEPTGAILFMGRATNPGQ